MERLNTYLNPVSISDLGFDRFIYWGLLRNILLHIQVRYVLANDFTQTLTNMGKSVQRNCDRNMKSFKKQTQ